MKVKFNHRYFGELIKLAIIVLIIGSCESTEDKSLPLTSKSSLTCVPEETIILTNGVIIDGTGHDPICNKSIIIVGNRIFDIIDDFSVDNYSEARIINLNQAFVLPGFINSHVHTQLNDSNLKAWAKEGVTTVRDGGFYGATIPYFEGRDQLNSDDHNARLVSAGPLLTTTGGYGMLGLASVNEARSEVNRLINEGVDFIKIAIEDNLQGRTWPMLSNEKITAITETAHQRNKWVCAHLSRTKHVRIAIDCNVNELSHMVVNHLPDEMIDELVNKDIYWNPTLELWKGTDEMYNANWCQIALNNLSRFVKKGGKVALGTDFGGYITPFELGMPMTEMKLMEQAGMSNMQIIEAATKNASKVCGKESELGTIEKGKIADLLLVSDNPLDDLNALKKVCMVIKNGSIIVENSMPEGNKSRQRYCPPSGAPVWDGF